MSKSLYISKWVRIENRQVLFNDELLFSSETTIPKNFAKEVYQMLKMEYPKFFKMDHLSKWAVLGAEIILASETSKNIALLFSNAASSLHTDTKHQESIQNKEAYYPSPAVFVYTLPNICVGEVSIKHKLQTESVFLVGQEYDTATMHAYAEYLIRYNKAEKALCGWIDVINNEYKLVLYLVESEQNSTPHTITEINKIFKNGRIKK